MRELRYALRGLKRTPLFSLAAISILGLGIGSSAAVFSVVNGVLLEPLPFSESGKLARAWKDGAERGFDHFPLTYTELEGMQERSRSFAAVAGMSSWNGGETVLVIGDRPRALRALAVTTNFFDVLDVSAELGRTFIAEDDELGEAPAVVLSYGTWRAHFASDPSVLGQSFETPGSRVQDRVRVVGVLPPDISYPPGIDAYIVAVARRGDAPGWDEMDAVGRLRDGVSLEEARAELETIISALHQDDPDAFQLMPIAAVPLLDTVVGDVRAALWYLLAAVGLVLLVAAANVSSLLLVRGAARERELAIRLTLGAGRARISRQLFIEVVVLAAAGAALGVTLAHWGLRLLLGLLPQSLPREDGIALDLRVLLFAVTTTVVAAVASGLVPAWRSSRQDATATLRLGRGVSGSLRSMTGLVVGELALALVLVVAAGLLVRAFSEQARIERGFVSESLALASLQIPLGKYDAAGVIDLSDRLVERVRAIPGVHDATPAHEAPGEGHSGVSGGFRAEGVTEDEARNKPWSRIEFVHENFFRTLGVPLVAGRTFEPGDRGNRNRVTVVTRSFAEVHFKDVPPERVIGRRLGGGSRPLITVVGVVEDLRYRELGRDWLDVYFPAGQNPFSAEDRIAFYQPDELLVRSSLSLDQLAPALRAAVREVEPDIPMERVVLVDRLLEQELAGPRFQSLALSLFAAVALLLAAIGVYGVMAAVTRARSPEIGIRLALGSTPARAAATIWRQGALVASGGIGLGLVAALATTRWLGSLLYGVSPLDPVSFGGATLVLAAAAGAAVFLPARRAARIDPAVTLRHE